MKPFIRALFKSSGLGVYRRDTPLAVLFEDPSRSHLAYALAKSFRSLEQLRFLQVGANDGKRNDPICSFIDRYGWSGVFMEPDSSMMAKLREHREGERFVLIEQALGPKSGQNSFYFLEGEGLPAFANGLGTLSRQRIEQAAKDLAYCQPRIAERRVECIGVEDLLAKVGIEFDVCVIDVEGLDYEVVSLLAEANALPPVLHYEHKCLSEQDRDAAFHLLMSRGYNLLVSEDDCTAYLRR